MGKPLDGDVHVRRSIETNGPADSLVVQLENELNAASQSGGAPGQIVPIKQQLLNRYRQTVIERGARLVPQQLGKDVFFEAYNQRVIALSQELGEEKSSSVVLSHLFLSGIYRQRAQTGLSRQHLAQFRQLAEQQPNLIAEMGDAVVGQLTTMVQALLRPDLPYPTPHDLISS